MYGWSKKEGWKAPSKKAAQASTSRRTPVPAAAGKASSDVDAGDGWMK